jgi:hypothetical protein
MRHFSPERIRLEAKDGWISTILLNGFVLGMMVFGFVIISRFAYKKIWREWVGAYADPGSER